MQATKGDHVIVHGRNIGRADRHGQVIDVRGKDGQPPYLVRWEPDGHEGLVFPGPDCEIQVGKSSPSSKTKATKKPAAKKKK